VDKTLRVVIDANHIKHFPHKEFAGVKIVHIRKLLQVLEKMEKSRPNSEKRTNGKF
jgi:hypothetical protein